VKPSIPAARPHPTFLAIVLAVVTAYGCAAGPVRSSPNAELGAVTPGVAWLAPEVAGDLASLGRWRRSVGPPVVVEAGPAAAPVTDQLVVVNWNLHVGGGDLRRLLADVRRAHGDAPIVLLLQEAYRAGPEVPATLAPDAVFASVIRGLGRDGRREEIEAVASSLGLHAYYVPSMRNGAPQASDEDRGNAILSTMPLTDLTAIELPFEAQRRVAVAATVEGVTSAGAAWKLRVVSAHLDNMVGVRRLWIAGGEFARVRQARGLIGAIGSQSPVVLGADMNTWFGFRDRAYAEAARAFPQTEVTDRRATFRGLLRLDHLFFRLSDGWKASFRRAEDRYDSDHHPLVATIRFTGAAPASASAPAASRH
jgi:endonuclease/exonuclease/phosphatase family metal-dependent hydrolase